MKWHPYAAQFPMIEGEEWETFKASIKATSGPLKKVVFRTVKGEKEFLDGRNRVRACEQLKLKYAVEEVFLEDHEVKPYIIRANIHRRHLDVEARRILVNDLREDGHSVRAIAEKIGVPKSTVHEDIKAVRNRTPEAPDADEVPDFSKNCTPKVVGKDGKVYAEKAKPKPKQVGKVKFDWKKWDKEFGTVIRSFENLKKAYPDNPDMKKADRLLDDIAEAIKCVRAS